jgi:hypothetical protein
VLPVYRAGLPRDTVEDRRRNLVGFAQGVFQTGVMIEDILASTAMAVGLDLYFFAENSGLARANRPVRAAVANGACRGSALVR